MTEEDNDNDEYFMIQKLNNVWNKVRLYKKCF